MTDFYKILSIPKTADSSTIKTAYKKLAVKYHPDKNLDNQEAEDKFKQVNEAYQTLSDPLKKANYDYLLTYGFEPPVVSQNTSNSRTYYKAEKVRPIPRKLSFLYLYIFLGFALFILGGYYFFNYMEKTAAKSIYLDAKRLYMQENNPTAALNYLELALDKDDALAPAYFLTGKILFEEAKDYNASMYYFENAVITGNGVEDSIGSYYFWRGKNRLKLQNYSMAINDLEAAYAYLNTNTELILSIADTYLYKLNLYDKALYYYNEALSLNPNNFDALLGKGVTLQKKIAYDEAAIYFENALHLKPQAGEVYYYMAIQALSYDKDTLNACNLWQKASLFGVKEAAIQSNAYCEIITPEK